MNSDQLEDKIMSKYDILMRNLEPETDEYKIVFVYNDMTRDYISKSKDNPMHIDRVEDARRTQNTLLKRLNIVIPMPESRSEDYMIVHCLNSGKRYM